MRILPLLLTALAACGPDLDGDGFRGDADCDDRSPVVNPDAVEACDGVDTDCDGVTPPAERDQDGDGWVDCAVEPLAWLGTSAVLGGGDCDDTDPERFPGAPERCNGVSDACAQGLPATEQDGDGDGFVGCQADGEWRGDRALAPGDCDDGDAERSPRAPEACDGLDSDCDGLLSPGEVDADHDGFVPCTPPPGAWKGDAGAWFGDCDDAAAAVNPDAIEVCDGVDGDCDGAPGPGEADVDHDGVMACDPIQGSLLPGGDCDDSRPETLPGAPEVCDGLDNDCAGGIWLLERDLDRDGYVACRIVTSWSGDPTVFGDDDCNDLRAEVRPDAAEELDGADTNCDGVLQPLERDDDNDGYVEMQVDGDWLGPATLGGGDCDDSDPDVSPGATERCDGLDQTCDGQPGREEQDVDGDGFVACAYNPRQWRGTFVPQGGSDCDDRAADVHAGASEVCDLLDNDCDGLTDEDDPDLDLATRRTFWRDDDHDDFGQDGDSVVGCRLPDGYAPTPGDCDDVERPIHPIAREVCDGIDNDCDGLVDDEDPKLVPELVTDWYQDADGDGDGDPGIALAQCAAPGPGWSTLGTDCDDTDPGVFLGAPELCNGIDDDCDHHPDLPGMGGGASELGCDLCTTAADYDPDDIADEKWNPCVLDPTSVSLCYDGVVQVDTHEDGNRLTRVAWRTDVTGWRPELFLFIPPSKGTFNTNLLRWTAQAGYHTVILSTATETFLTDVCDETSPPECGPDFLEEAHYGVDTSGYIDIGPSDGLEDRLLTVLQHLAVVHPGAGWDAFVSGGAVDWSKVIVSGWSKGAPHAVYAATINPVAGLVLFSSPNEPVRQPVDSPDCRNFAIYQDREPEVPVSEFESGFRSMGMDGPTFLLEWAPYPWAGDPQIFTTSTYDYDRDDCSPHKAVAFDGCMDDDGLITSYVDLFCHVGEVDAATCP